MSAPATDAPHGVSVVEPTKASPENVEKANKLKEQGAGQRSSSSSSDDDAATQHKQHESRRVRAGDDSTHAQIRALDHAALRRTAPPATVRAQLRRCAVRSAAAPPLMRAAVALCVS